MNRASGGAAPTVLAFDFGLKRIGVAVGNVITSTAQPLRTLTARAGRPDWAELTACFEEWHPGVVLVGVPYNMDGSSGEITGPALAFAEQVRERFAVAVETVDERLSSREAEATLRQRRSLGTLKRRIRHEDVDSEAACVLLRQWLNAR